MSLEPWTERQRDFAYYFNPAYIGILTFAVVRGYGQSRTGMPISLLFPAVPMVLHPAIRENLPRTTATRLSKWLRDHPDVRVELLSATRLLVPQIKEGALTALRAGWIVAKDGLLAASKDKVSGPKSDNNFDEDQKKAMQVGRWLAVPDSERDIYEQIGIKP